MHAMNSVRFANRGAHPRKVVENITRKVQWLAESFRLPAKMRDPAAPFSFSSAPITVFDYRIHITSAGIDEAGFFRSPV